MSDHPDCGDVGDLDPTGHLCVRCVNNDRDKHRCKVLTWSTNEPPLECATLLNEKTRTIKRYTLSFADLGIKQTLAGPRNRMDTLSTWGWTRREKTLRFGCGSCLSAWTCPG